MAEKDTNKELTVEEIKKMNVFEKLSAISLEITNVNKNLNVSVGKSGSYKAVGEADVLAAVRPAEAKFRIYSYPINRTVIESGTVDSTRYDGTVVHQLFERIEVTYRFVNMDKPEEYIDIISYGDGIDNGDKSVGKAMTYADKYALLKAYKIITGEDPDQEASEPLSGKSTKPTTPKPTTTPKKGVSESLVKELESMGSSLEKVAAYKKCKVEDLTDAIVSPVLMAMKKKLASKKGDNIAPTEATTNEVQPEVPNDNE